MGKTNIGFWEGIDIRMAAIGRGVGLAPQYILILLLFLIAGIMFFICKKAHEAVLRVAVTWAIILETGLEPFGRCPGCKTLIKYHAKSCSNCKAEIKWEC
jgi:hypothetical protein